jgi:heme/copper-type cytochrome/quinol oxidase subunit 3
MATVVHDGDHGHGLDLATRITRARVGGLLLILSDAGFVAGTYVSQGYLSVLNMQHQYRPTGDNPPSIVTGFILALVIVASAGIYFWGWRGLNRGDSSRYQTGVIIAWVLALIALVAQIVVLFGLRYATPIHGYDSLTLIMTAYHALHLLVTSLLGFLLLGRIRHGRIAGHEYVAEVSGFWWYYVALSAVATWAMLSFVK